jgi:hypothetical protein
MSVTADDPEKSKHDVLGSKRAKEGCVLAKEDNDILTCSCHGQARVQQGWCTLSENSA